MSPFLEQKQGNAGEVRWRGVSPAVLADDESLVEDNILGAGTLAANGRSQWHQVAPRGTRRVHFRDAFAYDVSVMRKKALFQVHLSTLLLAILWIGIVLIVWLYREPWELVRQRTALNPPLEKYYDSQDGVRAIKVNLFTIDILDRNRDVLYTIDPKFQFTWYATFIDDETVVCGRMNSQDLFPDFTEKTYRRRFPEQWWGQLVRPEVWALAVLSLLILRRIYFIAVSTRQ